MTFLAPGALWALLALAVPLLLHLRRRRVGRTIAVGSIRHLETLPTAERRGLRLRDRRLLLLRALIVAALALLLARPALDRSVPDATPFALIDSAASPALLDSLDQIASLSIESLDDPWRRVQEVDDSLPSGLPLIVAASNASDHYDGPRPTVARQVQWIPIRVDHRPRQLGSTSSQQPEPSSPLERRALAAALAAAAEEFGPLTDSAGWLQRLPDWWRDSIAAPAFPLAVARAALPSRTGLAPTLLSGSQLLPRLGERTPRSEGTIDLHWWFWAAALLLFLLERGVATRWRDPA